MKGKEKRNCKKAKPREVVNVNERNVSIGNQKRMRPAVSQCRERDKAAGACSLVVSVGA